MSKSTDSTMQIGFWTRYISDSSINLFESKSSLSAKNEFLKIQVISNSKNSIELIIQSSQESTIYSSDKFIFEIVDDRIKKITFLEKHLFLESNNEINDESTLQKYLSKTDESVITLQSQYTPESAESIASFCMRMSLSNFANNAVSQYDIWYSFDGQENLSPCLVFIVDKSSKKRKSYEIIESFN